ncbi:MAG: gliding motility-associated C-terminal domain-containing protein [Chitinophagaceae bacterium]|nr:gliding motility-associated C-terminal domain-containing protein [Chitinophagaceae bacterium]
MAYGCRVCLPGCLVLRYAVLLPVLLASLRGNAQTCPPNIDFENGSFTGWTCYTGNVVNQGGVNVFNLTESGGPVDGRHTIIAAASAGLDPYGNFPMKSPNGSAYSIRLGNDMGGGEGEAISYEFTIPANRNTYSLVYYYAVVFQDPNHQIYEQPRMEIEITNLSTNSKIDCASFSFIPFGSSLPGFFQSPIEVSNTPIWCKDWTPVTINLDGNAGKTIRLTFRTGDCTFRRHFGYAYIDVDSDCSGEFTGASFCPLDEEVTVSAPFGFQRYTWFNADMSRQLGTGQSITLRPPPPPGTTMNVQLVPYDGYGCPQTLTARLQANLNLTADAGSDTLSCNGAPVRIGSSPRAGLDYSWSPAVGLSNARTGNPIAIPPQTTDYVLTVKSPGGGCVDTDTVRVKASNLANSLEVLGRAQYCIGSSDSAILQVAATDSIRWFRNGQPIPGETLRRFRVSETGVYAAWLKDMDGCTATTPDQPVNISSIPKADFSANNAAQCLVGNRFSFANGSTNQVGTMQYHWDFGGAGISTDRQPAFSFAAAGTYAVKLVVSSSEVCADSLELPVTVYPNPVPAFDAVAACTNLPFAPINRTLDNIGSPVRYAWRYSTGFISDQRVPAVQVFTSPGPVTITLAVSSDQCPQPQQILTRTLRVESPQAARRYTTAFAVKGVPLTLEARRVGVSVQWQPATQLSDPNILKPVFKGTTDQDYTIVQMSEGGCVTVDSLLVQLVERADIHVPTGFTPNGDGLNDWLRPVPMGVAEIRHFRVFNRWGQVLYEARSEKPGWDGRINGVLQAAQTLVWMVEGVGLDGSIISKKGTTVLIR